MDLTYWLQLAVRSNKSWESEFGSFQQHPLRVLDEDVFDLAFTEFTDRLRDNYPFFHPRYAGHMVTPPHPAALIGYLATMLLNPNNQGMDGGPATSQMESEVMSDLANMFGFDTHLGHLTSSGTIANLEALYVARETHPRLGVAYSADAHYTHERMCHVLGMTGYKVPTDAGGRMDLNALEELLRRGDVGTVVLTAGTTGLGAVDPVAEALILKDRYGVRLHVDAAYGGFFALLARADPAVSNFDPAPWLAIPYCDSVVVDPHKHGLQPYGCGAVLFADPSVSRHYAHNSPYTYFASEQQHLGKISLECSRAGAAAAALWLTLRVFPLRPDGLGALLATTRRAALRFAHLIEESTSLSLFQRPDLDIVTYFPGLTGRVSAIDADSERIFKEGMAADPSDAVFLTTLQVDAPAFTKRGHGVIEDVPSGRILRSVLMKPEHDTYAEDIFGQIETITSSVATPTEAAL